VARPVVVIEGGAESVTMTPPKLVARPTATQLAVLMHDTPNKEPTPVGAVCSVHPVPPDVVLRMVPAPTAVHMVELRQDTPESGVAPAGVPSSVHVEPPFVVAMT
jgi:hypothetical protein